MSWMNKLSRNDECVTIERCNISRLLFASDLVLLSSTKSNFQHFCSGSGLENFCCGSGLENFCCGSGLENFCCGSGLENFCCGSGLENFCCGSGLENFCCGSGLENGFSRILLGTKSEEIGRQLFGFSFLGF